MIDFTVLLVEISTFLFVLLYSLRYTEDDWKCDTLRKDTLRIMGYDPGKIVIVDLDQINRYQINVAKKRYGNNITRFRVRK